MTTSLRGRWRLLETDLWGDDSIDLLEEAYIEFAEHQLGSVVVGALQAGIDYRDGTRDGRPSIEFAWSGDDDGHPVSGRGWAQLEPDEKLRVQLYIYQGDETVMLGARVANPPTLPPSKPRQPRRAVRSRRR
jgi:hypothetical protein